MRLVRYSVMGTGRNAAKPLVLGHYLSTTGTGALPQHDWAMGTTSALLGTGIVHLSPKWCWGSTFCHPSGTAIAL